MVYDCTCEESFTSIPNWMQTIDDWADEEIVKILVANKADIEDNIQITHENGRIYANNHGFHFFPSSALTGMNVTEIFEKVGILAFFYYFY